MADEIRFHHSRTGETLYALLFNATGKVWNGAAFETFSLANWATYDLALAEDPAGSSRYAGDMPTPNASGWYYLEIYERAGAAPLPTDPWLGAGAASWDGVNLSPPQPSAGGAIRF